MTRKTSITYRNEKITQLLLITTKMNRLIAIDDSGSTGGSTFYWSNVTSIIANASDQDKFMLWDSESKITTLAVVRNRALQKAGMGGTVPNLVAQKLVNDSSITHLVLITDGEVTQHDVDLCDQTLQRLNRRITTDCHVISHNPNLSVTCPFSRLGETTVHTYQAGHQVVLSVSAEDMAVLDRIDTINTYQELLDMFSTLENVLTVQNMGRDDYKTRDRLLAMQARILRNLAETGSDLNEIGQLKSHLENGSAVSALSSLDHISRNYYIGIDDNSPTAKIAQLTRLCAMRNSFSIDQIRSNRAARAATVQETVAAPLDTVTGRFECPITFESENPVLLVSSGTPVLSDVDTFIVDDVTNWPFHLMRYTNVYDRIKSRLLHVVGHETGLQLTTDGMQCPFTRQPLVGFLCLGENSEHVKATNWVLSQIFTGGKAMGPFDMWYALLVYYIKHDGPEYLRENSDLISAMERHLVYRLKTRRHNLNLTSLPEYVNKLAPFGVCLWSTLHSTLLNDPTSTLAWDASVSHVGTYNFFYYCLGLIGYPLHDHVKSRNEIISVVSAVMAPGNKTNIEHFRNKIRALYQNHIWYPDGDEYIFLDGPANELQIREAITRLPARLREFPVDLIVSAVNSCYDPQLSLKNVHVPRDFVIQPGKWVKNYNYDLSVNEAVHVVVSPKTMRPVYRHRDKTWRDLAIEKNGDLSGQISGYALYIQCCASLGMYPDEDTYIRYCYRRQKCRFTEPTLPHHISVIYRQVNDSYTVAGRDRIPVSEFIRITNSSLRIVDRESMEN